MCVKITFHHLFYHVSPAEIMEEEVFCAVQNQWKRTSTEVLQESRGKGQATWRNRFVTVCHQRGLLIAVFCYSFSMQPINNITLKQNLHISLFACCGALICLRGVLRARLNVIFNICIICVLLSVSHCCTWALNSTRNGHGSRRTSGAPHPVCSTSGLSTGTTSSSGTTGQSSGFYGWYKELRWNL